MPGQDTKPNDMEKITAIRTAITERERSIKQRHPWLKYQNTIGLCIFVASIALIVALSTGYLLGAIPAWLTIIGTAVSMSFLHELEHDLIHWQYFKRNKFMHHLMMTGVWLFRPNTINPWIRRRLHILHHKTSGTAQDIEERGIGNGQQYGPLRLLIMMDTFVGNIVSVLLSMPKGRKLKSALRILAANFPLPLLCAISWYSFLGFHLVMSSLNLMGIAPEDHTPLFYWMGLNDQLIVILVAPAYLRSFCLNFISSSMHYYGDVSSLLQQTQVLRKWYFWPLQCLCFNFGNTHGIHHFVVGQPFYLRQWCASTAYPVMKEHGVRFNDLGTFRRRNRFSPNKTNTFREHLNEAKSA